MSHVSPGHRGWSRELSGGLINLEFPRIGLLPAALDTERPVTSSQGILGILPYLNNPEAIA